MAKKKKNALKTSDQNSNEPSQVSASGPTAADINDLRCSVRSDVLNRVTQKYDQKLKNEFERLRDDLQIETERIARDREEKLVPRLKESIQSRIMHEIREGKRISLDDEVENAIKASLDDCLRNSGLEKPNNNGQNAPSKHGSHTQAARQSFCQCCAEDPEKRQKDMTQTAVGAEREARSKSIDELQNALRQGQLEIKSLEGRCEDLDVTVTRSLATIDEFVQKALIVLQTSTGDRLRDLEQDILARMEESQAALAIQVDHVTALWKRVEQMQLHMERDDRVNKSQSERSDLLGDLLSFD